MGKNVHLITYTDGEVGYRVVKILEYRRIKGPNSSFNVAAAVVVVLVVFFFLLSLVASVFLAPASSPLAGGP